MYGSSNFALDSIIAVTIQNPRGSDFTEVLSRCSFH